MEEKRQEEGKVQPKLIVLFLNTLYISTFTFGGGFVIVSFMKKIFMDKLKWLTEQEMLDITAIAESSPGPIAVNAAIQVGWHTGGFPGMITAVLGTIIPPMVIITVISFFYEAFSKNPYVALFLKGMQAAVAAIILDVVLSLGKGVIKQKSAVYDILMAAAFLCAFFLKINVVFIIIGAILAGVILLLFQKKKEGKEA